MITFENSIEIDRPVEDVFEFVSDFRNVPRWNYYVDEVRQLSDEPVGIGSTYHQVRKTDEQRFRVTHYQPDRRVVIETLPGYSPQFQMRFEFEPHGDGTKLVDAWQLEAPRIPLVSSIATGRVKAAVAENLSKLKELLETRETHLQDGRVVRL